MEAAVKQATTTRRFTRLETGNRAYPAALSVLLHVVLAVVFVNASLNRVSLPSAKTGDTVPVMILEFQHDREARHEAPSKIDVPETPSMALRSRSPHRAEPSSRSLPELVSIPAIVANPGGGELQPPEPAQIDTASLASAAIAAQQAATSPAESTLPVTSKVRIDRSEQAMLVQRVTQVARSLGKAGRTELVWLQDGQPYRAVLSGEAGADDMDLERVRVEDTTRARNGKDRQTQMTLRRVVFSQFTQVIDHWDQEVQLHDDEIIGRFHSNSTFLVSSDPHVKPRISGMTTTTASDVMLASAGTTRHRNETFEGGFEARAMRISLPNRALRLDRESLNPLAHVHRFDYDAHVTLYQDGHYTWDVPGADVRSSDAYPQDRPTYFIATPRATLSIKGTVNGRVLVYAPRHIVIEGDLRYADDPRVSPHSDDYLGLVSDQDVEVARPSVTGPGDLHIEAAIFARRSFVIRDFETRRAGTLSIYGSLTSGTMTASEPRYATRIEFDPRLSEVQLPGFPATNHYDVERWDTQWDEVAETTQDPGLKPAQQSANAGSERGPGRSENLKSFAD
jgi:hypothetical protein